MKEAGLASCFEISGPKLQKEDPSACTPGWALGDSQEELTFLGGAFDLPALSDAHGTPEHGRNHWHKALLVEGLH